MRPDWVHLVATGKECFHPISHEKSYNLAMLIALTLIASLLLLLLVAISVIGIIGYNRIYKRTKKPYCVLDVPDDKFLFPLEVKERYKEYIAIPCVELHITNERKKVLYGELRRNEKQKNAKRPILILFSHGHLSSGANDIALFDYFTLKRYDVLAIDHESSGKSEGRHSGFGVYEAENIELWVKKINEIYGHNVDIYLHGVSMGSFSVLLTSDRRMENVKGIIGDCGYTSTYGIVRHLCKSRFVAFSVCLFNSLVLRRNVFKYKTEKSLAKSLYPVLLFHGEEDKLVPFHMSEINDAACSSKHRFVGVSKAKHAMSYLTDPKRYEKEFDDFIESTR